VKPNPLYGNEWLLNLYALRECGIALVGPPPRELVAPIDIELVREASANDLLSEWEPLLHDPSKFDDSHQQAYFTLTLCRILHRASTDEIVSKPEAAARVAREFGEPWSSLVGKAQGWRHGRSLDCMAATPEFIRFNCDGVRRRCEK
jgi:hypothetical protein